MTQTQLYDSLLIRDFIEQYDVKTVDRFCIAANWENLQNGLIARMSISTLSERTFILSARLMEIEKS